MEKLINKEVFIVMEEEIDDGPATVFAFSDYPKLLAHLWSLDTEIDNSIIVYHGSLTNARELPSNIDKDVKPFVIISDGPKGNSGVIPFSESDTVTEIEDNIIDVLDGAVPGIVDPKINQLFVFYGYKMELRLHVSEDDIDEEKLDKCSKYIPTHDNGE